MLIVLAGRIRKKKTKILSKLPFFGKIITPNFGFFQKVAVAFCKSKGFLGYSPAIL